MIFHSLSVTVLPLLHGKIPLFMNNLSTTGYHAG